MSFDTEINQLMAQIYALKTENELLRDLQVDAERYRYWRDKLISVDFDYQDSGECVVILESPKKIRYSASFDVITDAAIQDFKDKK